MRVAVDARTMGSRPSGIGIYLYDFVRELVLNRKHNRIEILLITDIAESEQMQFFKKHDIPIICYKKRVFRSAGVYPYFNFVRKVIIREHVDLFWEPNNLLPIRLIGYHGKLVLTIHDLFPMITPKYFPWIYRIYFRLGIYCSLKQADAVLFNSMETQKLTQKSFPIIREKHTFVSYLIVQRPPIRTISDDGFFLYIGNLEKRKGSDLLLLAYRAYCEMGGTKPLYIGGKLREKDIRKLLLKIQAECPQLHYLGYVDEDRKYTLLSKCSCFFFPSKAEGFGLPPLEAAGYYKPIITSNLSIFHEILRVPVKTFSLEGTEEQQIEELSQLMFEEETTTHISMHNEAVNNCSNETYEISPESVYDSALKLYQGNILAKKLVTFLEDIVGKDCLEESNENCI